MSHSTQSHSHRQHTLGHTWGRGWEVPHRYTADSHTDRRPSTGLSLSSGLSDQSPAPQPRLMTSSPGWGANSHANYCLLSVWPSGGSEKGGFSGRWEFSGCSHGMAPSLPLRAPRAGDRQKQMNSTPLSKSFSGLKDQWLHSSKPARDPSLQKVDWG